jgi:hypothetical protein
MQSVHFLAAAAVLSVVLLCVGTISAGLAVFHAFRMYTEIKPSKEHLANLFPYLLGALPGWLTERGEQARKSFMRYLALAIITAAGAGGIYHFLGP